MESSPNLLERPRSHPARLPTLSALLAGALLWPACSPSPSPRNTLPPSVVAAFAKLGTCTLVSLDPARGPTGEAAPAPSLRGNHVLGSVVLSGNSLEAALNSVRDAVAGWDGQVARCTFQPRHALIYGTPPNETQILICFECGDVIIFEPTGETALHVRRHGDASLNELLSANGIPLASAP